MVGVAAAAGLLALTGCGSEDPAAVVSSTPVVTVPASPSAAETSGQEAAFIVAYRAGFPDLAAGQSDSKIARLMENTCLDIQQGKDELTVTKNLALRIELRDVVPTAEQAAAVYQLVTQHCSH